MTVPLGASDLTLTDWLFERPVVKERSLLPSPLDCAICDSLFNQRVTMDEIAPEYDVVVLGTGTLTPQIHWVC